MKISIAIVTYKSSPRLLVATLQSLSAATRHAQLAMPQFTAELFIIENEVVERQGLQQARQFFETESNAVFTNVEMVVSDSNDGFGAGHNQIINRLDSTLHLVLNPDVELAEDALLQAVKYFEAAPEVGALGPHAVDENGAYLYLCKRFPSVFDLLVRGFLPGRWRHYFRRRLERYEMHELESQQNESCNIDIASGCCMFVRTEMLQQVSGFDPAYFLYFEDFDLSLRLGKATKLAYVPAVNIIHHGGDASRKGLRHIIYFACSGFRFFNQHGWRWL